MTKGPLLHRSGPFQSCVLARPPRARARAGQRTGVPCGCCGEMPSAVVYLASASLPIAG